MPQSRDDSTHQLIELERAQIGHEIHDALLPLLFGASSGVMSAIDQVDDDPDQAKQTLIQASRWLSEALQTGRQLLKEIYPPELIGTLWVRVAKDTAEALLADSQVRIDWETDDRVEQTTKPIALAAYRIVVEAIRNAIRHGHAKHVQVDASFGDGLISVTIQDDGNGFNPTMVSSDRFGIRAMRGRADSVGGSLQIDSQPGGPTTITARFPTPNDGLD